MVAKRRSRQTGSFEVERTTGSFEVLDRLFVYGTMRQGQTARSLVANSIARSLPATTAGNLFVFPMGYPGYVDGDGRVVGEVLWLTDLAATFGLLDAYEGADFARTLKQVTIDVPDPTTGHVAGETLWTWIYSLADPATVSLGTQIPDGDWVRYWNEHQ
ncbi:MAG: gamma-glutamylcyclotransferase [Proteobacteria bacterium]|nr:gamma-glutamylcyclotransferase [Pseudomonadota bacterium]